MLALLLGEPGGEKVTSVLDDALLGAVNLAEIAAAAGVTVELIR